MNKSHLQDFEQCYQKGDFIQRVESERFKCFSIDEVLKRDKTNLDIIWLKDDSLKDLEDLPSPNVISDEIIENLKNALEYMKNLDI